MSSSLPRKFAALTALALGVLMLLMGGGHLYAVTGDALAQDRPLDYRLVSLITTGGLLVLPGIVGLVCLKWLWQGWSWAYGMCILSGSALMVYLMLLLAIEERDPTRVGSELELATAVVAIFLAVMAGTWLYLKIQARRSR